MMTPVASGFRRWDGGWQETAGQGWLGRLLHSGADRSQVRRQRCLCGGGVQRDREGIHAVRVGSVQQEPHRSSCTGFRFRSAADQRSSGLDRFERTNRRVPSRQSRMVSVRSDIKHFYAPEIKSKTGSINVLNIFDRGHGRYRYSRLFNDSRVRKKSSTILTKPVNGGNLKFDILVGIVG